MKKIIVLLVIFFIIISICITSYGKYIFSDVKIVANINIEGKPPKIEFTSVTNTNKGYEKYANRSHMIRVIFKVTEEKIKTNNIENNIIFLLDDSPCVLEETHYWSKAGNEIFYTYLLNEIKGNGRLKIKIPEGSVIDEGNRKNEETIFDTGIQIDNIAPAVSFLQENIDGGIVNAKLKANELIRPVQAWNLTEDNMSLSKEFECNVSYKLPVTDYAGNVSNVDIKIDKATKVNLRLGTISEGYNRWEFSTNLNEIMGEKTINNYGEENRIHGLSLYTSGTEKDFIQMNCFINLHWAEEDYEAISGYETKYYYGYNPKETMYASMKTGPKVFISGVQALFLGGDNLNRPGKTPDTGEGEPIPEDIAKEHRYGISAINFKLKDYSYYSIVYQIWVEGKGWLEPKSDGVEITAGHEKPFGLLRVSLIPKTEKQYLIDEWKKDVGTNNL